MCKQLLLDQNSSTFSHLIEKGIKITVLTDVGLCRIHSSQWTKGKTRVQGT